ncbi:MAG: hypothetical protein JSV61_04900 [Anaerolineales bacterium]|nr:MAG: hypothetical protein JSV61_04900 [Anaerolineales bacterium]
MVRQPAFAITKLFLNRVPVRSALATALYLLGSQLVGLLLGFALNGLPMHMPEATRNLLSALPVLVLMFAGGAAWGRAVARITGSPEAWRMGWAGALSFAPAVILAGITLGSLEGLLVERAAGPDLPIHQLFTLLFVPAAFIVAGLGGLALGIAQRDWTLAGKLGFWVGLAAAGAFLLVDIVMDALGWRVGAPGAAQRATMLTVMLLGNLGAALAGGAVVGLLLQRYLPARTIQL